MIFHPICWKFGIFALFFILFKAVYKFLVKQIYITRNININLNYKLL